MSKDKRKKFDSSTPKIDPKERELFLQEFYQEGSIDYDLDEEGLDEGHKESKVDHQIDEQDQEIFLNAVNQGVVDVKKDYEQAFSPRARRRAKARSQIDGSVDLHGMYSKDAVVALLRFVEREKRRGSKTLLIIHGKGAGVLKNAVWSIIETHPDVDDYQQAPGKYGGNGAIIVRINKKKVR